MKLSKHALPLLLPASIVRSEVQVPLTPPSLSPTPNAPDSRRIILRSTSNSISGSYPLYDLLSISTQSGSISVGVTAHSASEEDPSQPASLKLKSDSGMIHITFPETWNTAAQSGIPLREYNTFVATQSGSISGSFPLGLHTSFDSRSGSISGDLVVVPINTLGPRQLKTISHDGMQSLRVVSHDSWPATVKQAWWEGMVSRHEGHSGLINLDYPDCWEGIIEVEADSGSIGITGRGVQIIRQEQGSMLARKGRDGGGKLIVRARSGSVNIRFR
ncbi:hypothetical protein GGR51DRAFT_537497 [Nemania sp. FL0031]|nr:hypothetical protein GGR51DRAFT_537497 [Nemania sp. FL0031]